MHDMLAQHRALRGQRAAQYLVAHQLLHSTPSRVATSTAAQSSCVARRSRARQEEPHTVLQLDSRPVLEKLQLCRLLCCATHVAMSEETEARDAVLGLCGLQVGADLSSPPCASALRAAARSPGVDGHK
eukprot:2662419-Rhodomonas_salina.1